MDAENTKDTDAELMLRVRDDDQEAFRTLFERHARSLVSYLNRFFYNRAISEELAQEVFLKIFRARKRYEKNAKFTTWLYTIATRSGLNELRRGIYRRKHQGFKEEISNLHGVCQSTEEDLAGHLLEEKLRSILQKLPPNQRAAFLLVRFADHTYEEVAQILELSGSAVKSLVFRATEAVRQGLNPEPTDLPLGAKKHPLVSKETKEKVG